MCFNVSSVGTMLMGYLYVCWEFSLSPITGHPRNKYKVWHHTVSLQRKAVHVSLSQTETENSLSK